MIAVVLLSVAVVVLVAAGLVLLTWPTLLSGHACELTVESIGLSPKGEIEVKYRAVLAYGTELSWVMPGATTEDQSFDDSWDSCEPGFLRRPRSTLPGRNRIPLWPLTASDRPDAASMQNAIVLQPGTYRVRPGDELVYFRLKGWGGKEMTEGRLKVRYKT